ncbi:hypothetical protein [Flavobacterium fluviatile]|uniref:hypothetical protein n=1 Tax=Flavobacterium fluviatile TaxID=1862387 RepID=UPI0013D5686F|nr:hypothetical protein [Flavobacterium fluviatile]
MTKKILTAVSICLLTGISIYCYTYKEHRNIETETADYKVTVSGLEKEFSSNDSLAYIKYQDKTIVLTGRITAIDYTSNGIVLGKKIFATFSSHLPQNINPGKTLTIKGRFLGYDELLQEFKIDQTSVVR